MKEVKEYLANIQSKYRTGTTSEHTFREDLSTLLNVNLHNKTIINEPSGISCGKPDYLILSNDIQIGFIEAKDINANLNSRSFIEQFDRYKEALDNLIITNYLEFNHYIKNELVTSVTIGKLNDNSIDLISESTTPFAEMLEAFGAYQGNPIDDPMTLAELMAKKARLLRHIIEETLNTEIDSSTSNNLLDQFKAFDELLVKDIRANEFSDIYVQTIAYGLFTAYIYSNKENKFSRLSAAETIPKSSPFLRNLFQHLAGFNINKDIKFAVDNLANAFNYVDNNLLSSFARTNGNDDIVMYFYEEFLQAYDKEKKQIRGIYYTPKPIVDFMIKTVDDILISEFEITKGIASDEKIECRDNQLQHRVQILDPATGTGTFLVQLIKYIHRSRFTSKQRMWQSFATEEVLPRLNGFELLMAPYAIAHLKLSEALDETGAQLQDGQRFKVYLSNALEDVSKDIKKNEFANWLSKEAEEAKEVKENKPMMIVMGNPPYYGNSINRGKWILNLIEKYKYINGQHFGEKKHWLGNDYIKFIRLAESYIVNNDEGIVAYITSNSFLTSPTARGMRWNLMQSFDKIIIINLHGNNNIGEKAPDGLENENVFDIKEGVCISLMIKSKKNHKNKVHYIDLWGTKEEKHRALQNLNYNDLLQNQINPVEPYFFFSPLELNYNSVYHEGFTLHECFNKVGGGVVTSAEKLNISFTEISAKEKIKDIIEMSEKEWRPKYGKSKDADSWRYTSAKSDAQSSQNLKPTKLLFKPFDERYTTYTGTTEGLYARPSLEISQHLLNSDNIALLFFRPSATQNKDFHFNVLVSSTIVDQSSAGSKSKGAGSTKVAPLFVYDTSINQQTIDNAPKRVNFNSDFLDKFQSGLSLQYSDVGGQEKFTPIDIFDYIYATLYSPSYRALFSDFLKSDYPKVPYPKDDKAFLKLVEYGRELRLLHLLQHPSLDDLDDYSFPEGSNIIQRKQTNGSPGYTPTDDHKGRVWINDTQYFGNIPMNAWNFSMGGYRPAQKWLKDRYGLKLDQCDIEHYMKVIKAISLTDEIMGHLESFNWK